MTVRKRTKKPSGFEGMGPQQAAAWRQVFLGEPDDPSYQTVSEIARAQEMAGSTVREWIRTHPALVEMRMVRRAGTSGPVRAYRLKGQP